MAASKEGINAPRRIKVNIATPSHGDTFCGEYVNTLFKLTANGPRRGIDFNLSKVSYADIEVARNYLISNFYFNKLDCTHLLFIDDDMGFDDTLVFDMLALNKPVVGVIAPKRHIDLGRLQGAADMPLARAVAKASDFVGRLSKPRTVQAGFARAETCGTGVLLISRQCVDAMVAALPGCVSQAAPEIMAAKLSRYLTVFDKIRDETRQYSEDISFCKRWREQCGGEIWTAIDRPIQHVGRFVYTARFSDSE